MENRVTQGRKVAGAMKALIRTRTLSTVAARALHIGVLVPTLSYDSETLEWQENEKSKVRAVEMDMLRNVCRF